MSGLLLANLMIEDLTDVELEKHIQHCHRALAARTGLPIAAGLDELTRADTLPTPPADDADEDDGA